MARTFSRAATLYAPAAGGTPRTYGPFPVNGLVSTDGGVKFTLSVGPDWPTDPTLPVVQVIAAWDSGGKVEPTFNGGITRQDGTPVTEVGGIILVPREGTNKRVVTGLNLSLVAYQPFTTAITVAPVDELTANSKRL